MVNEIEGGFEEERSWYTFDDGFMQKLLEFLLKQECKSVVDFGCGGGHYVEYLNENGIYSFGFDANRKVTTFTDGLCGVLDLRSFFILPEKLKADWVISFDVGEHISKEFEENFITTLHENNKKGIVLSWARKGQRGNGHVNCQDQDYLKEIFNRLGYTNLLEEELALRKHSKVGYLKRGIMVFKK